MSGDVTAAIERLRATHAAATPGPWEHQGYDGQQNQNGDYFGGWIYDNPTGDYVVSEVSNHNGAFIAAAYNDLPILLAEVERLRAEVRDTPDSEAAARTVQMLRDENQRLRAEREALHSDETRRLLRHTISAYTNWPLVDDANCRAVEKAVDAVLAVLTADPEADQ